MCRCIDEQFRDHTSQALTGGFDHVRRVSQGALPVGPDEALADEDLLANVLALSCPEYLDCSRLALKFVGSPGSLTFFLSLRGRLLLLEALQVSGFKAMPIFLQEIPLEALEFFDESG